MTFARWSILLAVATGTIALPACNIAQFFRTASPELLPEIESEPNRNEFKALAPGERISKADVVVLAPTAPPHPEQESPAPPPPVPIARTTPGELPYGALLDARPRGPRPDNPLVAAVRAHLDNQFASAVGHLGAYERPNQELLLLLLPILDAARTTNLTGDDSHAAALLTQQLIAAAELTAKNAPLEIKTTAFVYRVVQFGVYDPLPVGHRFLPGGIGLLYAEIENVPVLPATQSNGERSFVTRLSGTIQLQDSTGKTIELFDAEKSRMVAELPFSRADFTRSPVRDFFLKIEFPVPEKPGRYSLTLDIRDPTAKGNRRTRKAVEFLVGP